MKNILLSFLLVYLFLYSLIANAQTKRIPEEEGNQKKRQEWITKRKLDPIIYNAENARWQAYKKSQNKLMEQSRSAVAGWESLGPNNQGGRVISHAFDPFDVETIWAGSASGGLWKTIDGGDTWIPITDQIPNLAIGAVAIQPQNPNIMLIGTGEGYLLDDYSQYGIGVLRSSDGGATWSPTNLTVVDSLKFACLGFAWDPININNVYLATTFGIYISNDAGLTWNKTLSGVGTSIVINKTKPQHIYASLQDYAGSTGGIYHSSNYGATWTLLTSGLPNSIDIGFTQLAICDSFPNVIYAGIAKSAANANAGFMEGLYKTSNGGNSWQIVPTGGTDFYCYPSPNNNLCQGWYANVLTVTAQDTNNIFIGGIYLYNTVDGGITWNYADYTTDDYGSIHPDHHSFGISPHNPNIMYSFNDGGVYKSTDGGAIWYMKPNGMITTQFYSIASSAPNKNLMIGGTQDNGTHLNTSTNTTQNWMESVSGDGFSCIMDPLNPSVWYVSDVFAGRMKTTNAGVSYDTINTGIVDPTYFFISLAMDPNNNQVLYTGTDVNFYKSINGGTTWSVLSNKPYISSISIDKINSNLLYICNDPSWSNSNIYQSTDGGLNWNAITEPGNKITDIETDPNITGTVYVVRGSYTQGQQVFKSINSGNTWLNITGDLPAIPVNTITIDPFNSDHIYIGTDLGVYLTTNGGTNWNPYNDNLPLVIVQDMHYYKGDSTIRIGTYGRGVWKTKSTLVVTAKNEIKKEKIELSVFPNPSNIDATIDYILPTSGNTSIGVYNTYGQKIINFSDTEQTEGRHSLKWNLKNALGQKVPAGFYYIRIIQSGIAYSCKVLVI